MAYGTLGRWKQGGDEDGAPWGGGDKGSSPARGGARQGARSLHAWSEMEAGGRRRDTSLRVKAAALVSSAWRRLERRGGLHGGQGGGGGGGMASGTSGMSGASEWETEAGREDRIPLFLRASE